MTTPQPPNDCPPLHRRDLDPDPFRQFAAWFQAAAETKPVEPNAMTLATAGPSGRPSARTVLLKEHDARGFVFFTSYEGRKGQELAVNPQADLLFYWDQLARQVRIGGRVEKVSRAESEAYWRTRPRASQLGAWASHQSEPIADRETLEARYRAEEERYAGRDVPLPPAWGGYRLVPDRFEFWQGRAHRLHDRFRYTLRSGGQWLIERLCP